MRLALVIALVAWAAQPSGNPLLVFTRVTIVDVEAGRLLPERTAVVAGSQIVAIDASRSVKVPSGANVADARGRTWITGLWTCTCTRCDRELKVTFRCSSPTASQACATWATHRGLNPARFLKRADTLGSVATGRTADLVLLEGDPLRDIDNTLRIAAVVVAGRLLLRADLMPC